MLPRFAHSRSKQLSALCFIVPGAFILTHFALATSKRYFEFQWQSSSEVLFGSRLREAEALNRSDTVMPKVTGYYINLLSRPDRRVAVEVQLSKLGIQIVRVEASDVRNNDTSLAGCWDRSDLKRCAGKIGCKLSHLKALAVAEKNRDDIALIFEDDFAWLSHVNPVNIPDILLGFDEKFPHWKVIGLSMNIMQQVHTEPHVDVLVGNNTNATVVRVTDAQTTHGYAIRNSYIPTLRATFESCAVHAQLHIAIDQCWKPLQPVDFWYGFSPQLGTQKPGFSDIEDMHVEYKIAA